MKYCRYKQYPIERLCPLGGDFLKIGYVRCSTAEQNEARQIEALKKQGIEKFFIDKQSGKNTDREGFQNMMSFVREGDELYVESISRLSRNTMDLLSTIETLNNKGVIFHSLKESLDTKTDVGKFVLTLFGAIAELERDYIRQRQREGIEIAKREGRYTGRKKISVDKKRFGEVYSRWRSGDITAVEAQRILGLKPNTFYRRVKEYEEIKAKTSG